MNQHGILSTAINVDYKKAKRFLLSILWRASISSRDFFSEVNLGETHEEIIRRMIWEGVPKSEQEYPCLLVSTRIATPNERWKIIRNPLRKKLSEKSMTVYTFPISGICYSFFVTRRGLPESMSTIINASTPKEEGSMRVIHVTNGKIEEDIFRGILGLEPA